MTFNVGNFPFLSYVLGQILVLEKVYYLTPSLENPIWYMLSLTERIMYKHFLGQI
jgi:hypothetical protein